MTIPLKHRSDGLGEFEPNDAVPIEHGGTGAKDAETARQNLGISSGGGEAKWIKADQVGVVNSRVLPHILEGVEKLHLEFAKIGGLLWVRGGFTVKETPLSAVFDYHTEALITLSSDYKMQALVTKGGVLGYSSNGSGWWMQMPMNVIRSYSNNGGTRLLFWSDRVALSAEQALVAKQELVCSNTLYAYDVCFVYPTPLGVLIS